MFAQLQVFAGPEVVSGLVICYIYESCESRLFLTSLKYNARPISPGEEGGDLIFNLDFFSGRGWKLIELYLMEV
jgi:hypothetical protein